MDTVFTVSIAGIGIRFIFPFEAEIPAELEPFLAPEAKVRVTYRAKLLHQPLCPTGEPVFQTHYQQVFPTAEGWLRIFKAQEAPDGCRAALLLRPDGNNTLYLPACNLERYRKNCIISHLLGMEYTLARHNCLLLHSSVVSYRGGAILFSGPSGVGKSTQAELWHRHAGAEIINGDRCVIARRKDGLFACGSPHCGSSGIRRQAEAPIRALIFLEHGQENDLQPASCLEAYRRLYSQIITNSWDDAYTARLCAVIEALIQTIPMYRYRCRPDESAVARLRETLDATHE